MPTLTVKLYKQLHRCACLCRCLTNMCDLGSPLWPLTLDDEAEAKAAQWQEGEDALLPRLERDVGRRWGWGRSVAQAECHGQLRGLYFLFNLRFRNMERLIHKQMIPSTKYNRTNKQNRHLVPHWGELHPQPDGDDIHKRRALRSITCHPPLYFVLMHFGSHRQERHEASVITKLI